MARRKQTKSLSIKNYENREVPIFYIKPDPKHKVLGWCCNPEYPSPYIIVDPELLPQKKLNVLIEEIFHAYFFDLPEWKARKFAANLGKVIYSDFIKKDAPHAP